MDDLLSMAGISKQDREVAIGSAGRNESGIAAP
jgi:hypothetical protein